MQYNRDHLYQAASAPFRQLWCSLNFEITVLHKILALPIARQPVYPARGAGVKNCALMPLKIRFPAKNRNVGILTRKSLFSTINFGHDRALYLLTFVV